MGEKSDQIERHIQEQRSELGDNISELEQKVKSAVDWRAQFDERPGVMIGLAFAGGVLLSALLPSNSKISSAVSSKKRSLTDMYDSYAEKASSSFDSAPSSSYKSYQSKAPNETWENLKGALVGMATARVGEFVEEILPGFNEHYKNASGGKALTTSVNPADKGWSKTPNGPTTDYASHS